MKFLGKNSGESDNVVWMSNSDLMAGLMIIFLFIAVGFIREKAPEVFGEQDFIVQYLNNLEENRTKINEKIDKEFTEEEKLKWNMEIIYDENIIRFNTPEIMFNQSSGEIKKSFKQIINQFFPRYVKILSEFKSLVREIRIEGHTSSEWGDLNKDDAFLRNLVLSQERTASVIKESMKSLQNVNLKEKQWAFARVTASGMSSRNLILDSDGKENQELSRRVEFKYLINTEGQIENIKKILEN